MNPNARDARGLTPLHIAANCHLVYWGPPDLRAAMIVEYLLFAGADPSIPFSYGGEPRYTVLHREAFVGNMVLVPMLVDAGANVNARDSRGFTPLHSAARCDFRMSCDDCTNPSRDDFFTRWKQGATPVIPLPARVEELRSEHVSPAASGGTRSSGINGALGPRR